MLLRFDLRADQCFNLREIPPLSCLLWRLVRSLTGATIMKLPSWRERDVVSMQIQNRDLSKEIRTAWIKCQRRPSIIQEAFLRAQLNGLDLTREAGRRPKIFQTSHNLDHSAHKRDGNLATETVMNTVAKWLHGQVLHAVTSAIGLEFLWIRDVSGITPCLALQVVMT